MDRPNSRTTLRTFPYVTVVGATMPCCVSMSFAAGRDEQRAACAPDVLRLCSSEIPDVERIVACMKAKKASLSLSCKATLTPIKDVRTEQR